MFPLIICCSLQELFLSLKTKIQVVFALLIIRKFGKNVVWFWQPAGNLGLYRMEQFLRIAVGLILELIACRQPLQVDSNLVADSLLTGRCQLYIHPVDTYC